MSQPVVSCSRDDHPPYPEGPRHPAGQGLVEYGLLLVLVAIICIVALIYTGGTVSTVLSSVGRSL